MLQRLITSFFPTTTETSPFVEYIAEKLKLAGLEPWLEEGCIKPGAS
jgi:hypothetical protein